MMLIIAALIVSPASNTFRTIPEGWLSICVGREHSYVQLCVGLSGSVPCPAPQAAASPDRVQVGRQGLLDVPTLLGRQWRLPAAPAAQSGPCGDLWRGDCRDISRLPPGQTGMDWYSASGAGQVRWIYSLNCCIRLKLVVSGIAKHRLIKSVLWKMLWIPSRSELYAWLLTLGKSPVRGEE